MGNQPPCLTRAWALISVRQRTRRGQKNGGSEHSTHPRGRAVLPDQKLLGRTDSPIKLPGLLTDGEEEEEEEGTPGRSWASLLCDCGELWRHGRLASRIHLAINLVPWAQEDEI